MTTSTYAPGTFCWHELGTRDREGAKKFFTALLGWTAKDKTMPGEAGTYSIFQRDGGDVTGCYEMAGPMFENVPPNWCAYVWTEDVDADVAKTLELGGEVIAPAMDVPGVGRIAWLKDPAGAMFAVFMGREHCGAVQSGQAHGTFCWNELVTRDVDGAKSFDGALFGWSAEEMPMGSATYVMFRKDGEQVAGMKAADESTGDAPPHWMPYLTVDDCDAFAAKVAGLGGAVYVPPTRIPVV
ncbi:MAG TPA: VOC family protein [Planctomycetota bacterium]